MKCDGCGDEFTPTRPWMRFHSSKCRSDFHRRERLRQEIETASEARRDVIQNLLNGNGHSNGHAEEPELTLASSTNPVLPPPPSLGIKRFNRKIEVAA
jgi:hypothetical protein